MWLLLLTFWQAYAFNVPRNLSEADRFEVVRTLGLNSANKVLSNPYPLGGYTGWEAGVSLESISVRDLRQLGDRPKYNDAEWRYARVTFGKGLYNDLDVFLSFIPPAGQVPVLDYGGALRYSAYQATFLPINVSLLLHANQLNFANTFSNRNVGGEVIAGINVDNFALYFGGGLLVATGTFIGRDKNGVCGPDCTVDAGAPVVNELTRTVATSVRATHTVIGFSYHYEKIFAAAEVDRYRDAVYSMKIGVRY